MSSETKTARPKPLDLSRWRTLPTKLMVGGGALVVIGWVVGAIKHDGGAHFAFSWLLAFMFCLSICLGSLFLVLAHHLFDAGWSVPIRRFCEQIASLLVPWMLVLWLPIGFYAKTLYAWLRPENADNHAVVAKFPLFTVPGFYIASALIFLIWWVLTNGLRSW